MRRKPLIDLVRTLSVIAIVGYHWFIWGGFSASAGPLGRFLFETGYYGVTLFFVVSGYLITGLLVEGGRKKRGMDLREFYVRRVARILPLFFLIVYWGWVNFQFAHDSPSESPLTGPVFHYQILHYGFWFWASLFTFLFNWTVVFGGPHWGLQWIILWSLAVEEQFYLAYPWVLKILRKRDWILVFLGIVILSGPVFRAAFVYSQGGRWIEGATTGSFSAFDQIAFGALLYFLSERWKKTLSNKALCVFLCVSGLGLGIWAYGFLKSVPAYAQAGPIAGPSLVAGGCFLFLLGGLRLDFFKAKGWDWPAFPGKLSYGCYLWHPTFLFFLAPWAVRMSFGVSLLMVMTATLALAWASEAFFERPANRLIRQLFKIAPTA